MLASTTPARPVASSRPTAAPDRRLQGPNDIHKQENERQQGELDEPEHRAVIIDRNAMGYNASQNQEGNSMGQTSGYFHTVGLGYHTSAIPKIDNSKLKTRSVDIDTKRFDKLIEQVQADMEKKNQGDTKMNQFNGILPQTQTTVGQQGVSGIVLDEKAEPMIGATVRVKGSNEIAVTDIDGRFTIQATTGQTLAVNYVGYITQDVVVNGNDLTVILQNDELLGQQNKELNDLFLRVKPLDKVNKIPSKEWMQQLLFCLGRLQKNDEDRHIYLSKLYDLCKDTEGLDQTDLKTAAQQLSSVYQRLKAKSRLKTKPCLKENELVFLKNMVDLLEGKIMKKSY